MNEISIAIKISEFDLDIPEISQMLNLIPSHSHYKGESYNFKTSEGDIEKVYESNYWEYRFEIESNEWVQIFINNFINEIILDRKNILQPISKVSRMEFFVGINYYEEPNPSFHFEHEAIKLLSDVGFSLDIDLYNFKLAVSSVQ